MAHGQGGAEIGVGKGPTLTCNHEAPIVAYESALAPSECPLDVPDQESGATTPWDIQRTRIHSVRVRAFPTLAASHEPAPVVFCDALGMGVAGGESFG